MFWLSLIIKSLRLGYRLSRFSFLSTLCLFYVCLLTAGWVLKVSIITAINIICIFIYIFLLSLILTFRFLRWSFVFWKTTAYPFLNKVCEHVCWLTYDIFCWTPYIGFDFERLCCVMFAMWACLGSFYFFFWYFNSTAFLYNTFYTSLISLTDYPSTYDWVFSLGFVPFVMASFYFTADVYSSSWQTVEEAQVYYMLYKEHGMWPKDVILQRGIWRELPRAIIVLVCYPFYLMILSWFLFVFLEIVWVLVVVKVFGIKSKIYFICFYFFVLYICFYLLVYCWDRRWREGRTS